MRRIRAIVYGVGTQGRLITGYMVEKGVDIVAAIDINPEIVGKDLGEVAGLGHSLGVKVESDEDRILAKQDADIAIVAVFFDMERMYPIFEKCVRNGLNVLSTSEELLYAWTTSPMMASKLDRLSKEHGVTITGSGLNNFRVTLVSVLTGACQKIDSIGGKQTSNLGPYGAQLLHFFHVGETRDEFYESVRKQALKPTSFRNTTEALISDLGLTITRIEEDVEPVTDDEDVMSESLGIVAKGLVTGVIRTFGAKTAQGVEFEGKQIIKVFNSKEKTEGCINEWFIKGVPNIHLKWDQIVNNQVTAASMVNIIPDIINSEPGYITVEKLDKLKYRAFPLHFYLR